jgi:phytoene synthase
MTRDELVAGAFASIQKGSKSFRAASRLFDQRTREQAWLLYAWCRHCDDVCDGQVSGFPGGVKGSVSALREKSLAAVRGETIGELPFDALGQLLKERPIPVSLLNDHLEGFELDERQWQPRNEADLILYSYHVAGSVGCMMAIVMGVSPDDRETLERASDLGIAFQVSNIARDLREDLRSGRCYVPQDWLAEQGIDRSGLFQPQNRQALLTIAARLIDMVDRREESARSGVKRLPFRSRLAILAAARIYGAIGRRVRDLGDRAWDERVTVGRMKKLSFVFPSFAEAIYHGARS